MTQQLRITKGPSERNTLDHVSKAMHSVFNEILPTDGDIVGIYTIPPRPLDDVDPQLPYFCDQILEESDGKKTPLIYAWREWGRRADQLIKVLDHLGFNIVEKPKEINDNTNTI